MYVARGFFPDATDGAATASNDVRMVRVTHFHLQRHSVTLLLTQRKIMKYYQIHRTKTVSEAKDVKWA